MEPNIVAQMLTCLTEVFVVVPLAWPDAPQLAALAGGKPVRGHVLLVAPGTCAEGTGKVLAGR